MIEFFKEPNIDWMGKAKYFYALSAILLIAGWTSVFLNHGLRYSIDFKGGTNVDVRFAKTPNIDQIRKGRASETAPVRHKLLKFALIERESTAPPRNSSAAKPGPKSKLTAPKP